MDEVCESAPLRLAWIASERAIPKDPSDLLLFSKRHYELRYKCLAVENFSVLIRPLINIGPDETGRSNIFPGAEACAVSFKYPQVIGI